MSHIDKLNLCSYEEKMSLIIK